MQQGYNLSAHPRLLCYRSITGCVEYTKIAIDVPRISIQSIARANDVEWSPPTASVRDYVILGFVPERPDTVLVIRNPLRLGRAHDQIEARYEAVMDISTAVCWTFNIRHTGIISIRSYWQIPIEEYRTMTSCSSAFIRSKNEFVQVSGYCPDRESTSGTIRFRSTNNFLGPDQQAESDVEAICSSTEIPSAVTCFAHSTKYITVLLRTRCIFFHSSPISSCSPQNSFWTHDTDSISRSMYLIFEFDIFVEQLLTKQNSPFGNNDSARWTYHAKLDTRDREVRQRQFMAVCKTRGHDLNLDHGSVFLVGVLGDDSRSILLLTLFVNPIPDIGQRNCLVLDGKRWKLAQKSENDPDKVLQTVMNQIFEAPKHDCRVTCLHDSVHTKVMAAYEADGTKSLDLIEGEYFHITAANWDDY